MSRAFWLRVPALLWAIGLLCTEEATPAAVDPMSTTKGTDLKCYQFTWPGNTNKTDCEKHIQPCFKPFVYSVPSSRPPNITALDETCKQQSCPEYVIPCTSSCIRWNWYDVSDTLFNYTLFCGTMSDVTQEATTGSEEVQNGCFQYRSTTFTKEVCVCKDNLCNGSSTVPLPPVAFLLLSVGTSLLMLWTRRRV